MTSHRSGPWCSSSPLHGRHRGTRVQARLAGRRRLGEHLWPPGLAHGSIGPHTAKAGPLRQEAVHVGIADVIVGLGLELRLHLRELMLQRHEVDDDVMVLPKVTLGTEWAVGPASDDIAQRFDRSHYVYDDETRGIPTSNVPSMSKRISFTMRALPGSAMLGMPSRRCHDRITPATPSLGKVLRTWLARESTAPLKGLQVVIAVLCVERCIPL
jgi:hypothetical protein